MKFSFAPLLLLMVTLAGCAANDPAATVQSYLDARVAADAVTMQQLSCGEWESQARLQAESFRALNAELQDVSCTTTSQTSDTATVTCDGRIVTSYDGENREFPLGTYSLVQQNSEWLMCGEGE